MEVEKLGREPAPTWDTSPLTWGISLLSHSAGPKDITLTHFFHLFEKQRDSKWKERESGLGICHLLVYSPRIHCVWASWRTDPELHLALPCELYGPKLLNHYLLPPQDSSAGSWKVATVHVSAPVWDRGNPERLNPLYHFPIAGCP